MRGLVFLLAMLLTLGACAKKDDDDADEEAEEEEGTVSGDPGYRFVVIEGSEGGLVPFPAADQDWTLAFVMTTPPIPTTSSWDPTRSVFYVWGDIDFDEYGSTGSNPLHNYKYNQIVPQLTLGWGLDASDDAYAPDSHVHRTWIAQAQYFWMHDDGTSYAHAGDVIEASPGDEATTTIAYSAATGSITVSISVPQGTSTVTSLRPFPNESAAPFASWKEFFTQAAAASSGVLKTRPMVNVESHAVDVETICSVLPLDLTAFRLPNSVPSPSFRSFTYPEFDCPFDLPTPPL